jgi:ABC transport system ATP-binding/permease protein
VQAPKELRRLGFREKEEFAKLEKEIDALTLDKDNLQAQITETANSGNFEEVNELSTKLQKLGVNLEEKTERWLELAERAEAMGTV